MFERRTLRPICFWGGLALLFLGARSLNAQLEEKKEDPAFPPPMTANLNQQVIRQTEDQSHGLILYTPKTWTRQDPTEADKEDWLALYTINEPGQSPVKLYVLYYDNKNANLGGGVQANILRWTNEFDEKDRKKKITTGQRMVSFPQAKDQAASEDRKYVLLDLKGTRNGTPNTRMLAAIIGIQWKDPQNAEPQSAVYFLKMSGPEGSITGKIEESFRQAFGALHKQNENELTESSEESK